MLVRLGGQQGGEGVEGGGGGRGGGKGGGGGGVGQQCVAAKVLGTDGNGGNLGSEPGIGSCTVHTGQTRVWNCRGRKVGLIGAGKARNQG